MVPGQKGWLDKEAVASMAEKMEEERSPPCFFLPIFIGGVP